MRAPRLSLASRHCEVCRRVATVEGGTQSSSLCLFFALDHCRLALLSSTCSACQLLHARVEGESCSAGRACVGVCDARDSRKSRCTVASQGHLASAYRATRVLLTRIRVIATFFAQAMDAVAAVGTDVRRGDAPSLTTPLAAAPPPPSFWPRAFRRDGVAEVAEAATDTRGRAVSRFAAAAAAPRRARLLKFVANDVHRGYNGTLRDTTCDLTHLVF